MAGILVQNSIIKQAEAEIEKRLNPSMKQNYMRVVVAGMKVAMNKGDKGLMSGLDDSEDPISDVVNGAIGIVGVLRKESRGTMPVEAMIPGAMDLVLHGLDYLDKSGIMKIGSAELDRATQMFAETIMSRLGVTPEKVQQLTAATHEVMQDPAKVTEMKQRMGVK